MWSLGIVGLGSALGGMVRYLVGGAIQRLVETTFPLGTLIVNITGSFLIGIILRFSLDTTAITPDVRAFLTIGFCGGYTTFSTFSWETVRLLEDGDYGRASLYLALSFGLSIGATALGIVAAKELLALHRAG
ncbi:MAG: fluoride efflux transporter CrcB [Gemmatimonadota bacterium]